MTDVDRQHFVLPNDQPFVVLECSTAFSNLTNNEKLYAHYLSRASWNGSLICLLQTSPESPLIFIFLHKLFVSTPITVLKEKAFASGFTEEDFQAFLVYSCGILSNVGNYKGFGDSKIVPNLDFLLMENLMRQFSSDKFLTELWDKCKERMFSLTEREKGLGMNDKGITTYFSANCTMEDSDIVNEWLKTKQIECYNVRTFKTVQSGGVTYEICLASAEEGMKNGITIEQEEFKGNNFKVTRGDYSKLLGLVCQNLEEAKKYAANDNEKNMIQCYINSFSTGSLNMHKDGSRFWIKDKGPVIET